MGKVDMSFIGKRFGKLTVIDFDHVDKHRNTCWLCKCDCGNELVVSRNHLTTGNTSSCGCLGHGPKREDIVGHKRRYLKHGVFSLTLSNVRSCLE